MITEQIESYLNGNISEFIGFLNRCTKKELLEVVQITSELQNIPHKEIIANFAGWLR